MSKNYAVKHVGIGNRRFKPGEELPPITDEQWKRLLVMGAIRAEHDPVEAELTLADEEDAQGAPEEDAPEDDAAQETAEGDEDAENADAVQMPEIDVMAGIAEESTPAPKAAKPKSKKNARKAGDA